MRYKVAGRTDVGLVRSNNEDAFLIEESLNLFVVADGMGGYDKGEVASQVACSSFADSLKRLAATHPVPTKSDLYDAIQNINTDIRQKIKETPGLEKMGSTVVSIALAKNKLFIVNVGDSRAYRLRGNSFHRIRF